MPSTLEAAPLQHELPNLPSPWRSISALAERLNAGAKHPTFTTHALRHMVRNPEKHGLQDAVLRRGRKILVHEGRFIAALEQQGDAQ